MTAIDLFELSGSTISRRAVLGAALGGLVTLGISGCGREGSADVAEPDTRSTDTTDLAGHALAGVPVEVWRDPG